MNKQKILIAAGLSFAAVLGYLGIRRFLGRENYEYDDEYYSDFHRHFEKKYRNEDNEGIEYLAMR